MLNILPMKSGMEGHYNQIDNRYLAGEVVSLKVGQTGFSLTYRPIAKAQWRQASPDERFAPEDLISSRDSVCYFAFENEQLVGQIVVFENFNSLAMIQNICVEARLRRQGIGKALMDTATDWAKRHGQKGLMLETRDSNPIACQFFESMGFTLGGLDQLLYTAMPEQQDRPRALRDSALFFYKLF
jgi:Acetyltransferases